MMKQRFLLGLCCLCLATALYAQEGIITVDKKQKSLLTKRTATWCPICGQPDIWPMVKNLEANLSNKALVVAGHHSASSTLYSTVAKDLIDNFTPAFSQPVFYFNRERIGSGGANTESMLNERADLAYQQIPLAQTGLRLTFDESQRLLEIAGRIEFYESTEGNYQLAYYLIRKSIIANQSNQGSDTEHINVLWESITAGSFGIAIDQESLVPGGSFSHQEQFPLPAELNPDNLIVAAIIWKQNEEGIYEFVNVERSDDIQPGIITQTYEPATLTAFLIQPTLTQRESLAIIRLSSALPASDLSIYNARGQKIKTIFRGDLANGSHRFELQVPTSGIYFVVLRSGNQISTQRLIKLP